MTRQEKKKIADPKIVTDAVEVAEEAGLHYVSTDQPGYTRKAKGDDLEYFDTDGKPIRDDPTVVPSRRSEMSRSDFRNWNLGVPEITDASRKAIS